MYTTLVPSSIQVSGLYHCSAAKKKGLQGFERRKKAIATTAVGFFSSRTSWPDGLQRSSDNFFAFGYAN